MITREECNTISQLKPWERTKKGYVYNLIISSSMEGDTTCEFDSIFTTDYEIKELKKLGYEVVNIKNEIENIYRVYWD